jgi:hypothetical protein
MNISFSFSVCSSSEPLPIELNERLHFVQQDGGLHRLEQKVHGSGFVAAEHAFTVTRPGRHHDDRNMLGALRAAHQLGEHEAVHLGHLNVDDRERDLVHEQQLERLLAAVRQQELDARTAQQRLEREEVVLDVVYQQDLRHAGALGSHRASRSVVVYLLSKAAIALDGST